MIIKIQSFGVYAAYKNKNSFYREKPIIQFKYCKEFNH